MEKTPIIRACEIMGSQKALADALEVSPSTVNQWVSEIRPIPAEHCPTIEKLTGGAVRCEDLLADVDWAYLRGTKKKAA